MSRIYILFASLLFALCGMAQIKDYCLSVGDFTELTVADNINVVYHCNPDSAGYATFTCSNDVAVAITFSNKKNKLKVEVVSDTPLEGALPTVNVYSLALVQATNWGDSTLVVDNINPGAKFKAKVIGNGSVVARNIWTTEVDASVKAGMGHIFLTGKAQKAKFSIISAGAIEAGGLEAATVSCSVFGTGSIDCNASEQITVKGTGPGRVFYYGDPKIKNYGVSVKVAKMNE